MAGGVAHEQYLTTRYFPFFDGLRCLLVAIDVVVLDHTGRVWPLLHGGVAVLVLFVMSGYLITTLLCRERSATGQVHIPAFFRRRLFRIVPLYYVVIAAGCILALTLQAIGSRRGRRHSPSPLVTRAFTDAPAARTGSLLSAAWPRTRSSSRSTAMR